MYFVYILKLKNGDLYKGMTINIDRRLNEHSQGKTQSMRKYHTFDLIHVELTDNLESAIKLEKYFKSGSGREILKELFD